MNNMETMIYKTGQYQYTIQEVHIDSIQPGDTVLHVDGELRTVCKSNIGGDTFMGKTLFGDSYHSGHKLVKKVKFYCN